MSGGSQKQTTQSSSVTNPYAPAQPGLQNLLTKATGLLDSNTGSGVYTGERYAGLGQDTLAGLDLTKQGAKAGMPIAQVANDFASGLLANGGATAGTREATAGLAGIDPTVDTGGVAGAAGALSDPNSLARTTGANVAGGAFGTDTSKLTGLADSLTGGQTQTQKSLQDVADGRFLNGSPQLDALVARSQADAASKVAQSMAASGRYGSGRFAAATADAVDNVGTNLRYTDLTNQQARQASAASAIDSAANARAGLAGSLLGQVAGINQGNASTAATGANLGLAADQAGLTAQQALFGDQSANTDRALGQAGTLLSAAQGDRAASMAGVAAVPGIQSALLNPGKTLAGIGAVQDQDRQSQDDAAQALFSDQQNNPWKSLGLASAIIDPIASLGSSTSGTSTTKQTMDPGILNSILGGIMGVGGTAANLGKSGAFGANGWLSSIFA